MSRRLPQRHLDIGRIAAVLLDVDGTLIDSNAAHAETWAAALAEHGYGCQPERVRPLIGMGADKLLPKIAGISEDSARGQAIARRKKSLFAERLPRLRPTPGARALVAYLRGLNKEVVIATSADEREMLALLRQAGIADLIERGTSKDDAEQSKPDPDIVRAALARAGGSPATTVMIGDTPYDTEAAHRAGIDAIALRCGGYWTDAELGQAIAIFDAPAHVLAHWQNGRRWIDKERDERRRAARIGVRMAKHDTGTGGKGGTKATDASTATTAAAIEERVVAFAEQLGRIAGTVKVKAEGWLDRDTLSQQLTQVRDAAADLLDQLASTVREAPKARPAAAPSAGATQRSGGVVDAPGKKHRKPMPADPDARRAASQTAKMRTAKTMVKTNRRRGRG